MGNFSTSMISIKSYFILIVHREWSDYLYGCNQQESQLRILPKIEAMHQLQVLRKCKNLIFKRTESWDTLFSLLIH